MQYLRLPDGGYFPVSEGQSLEDAWAEARIKNPNAFALQPNTTNSSNTTQVQTQQLVTPSLYGNAVIQSASWVLIATVLMFFIMPKKYKATNPLEMGRVWLAWSMFLFVFTGFKQGLKYADPNTAIIVFILSFLMLGPIAFALGWLYGKFFKFKTDSKLSNRVDITQADEKLYEIVANEIDVGEIQKGLWAKAFAQCSGEDAKTKALYIQMRVNQLKSIKTNEPITTLKENSFSNQSNSQQYDKHSIPTTPKMPEVDYEVNMVGRYVFFFTIVISFLIWVSAK